MLMAYLLSARRAFVKSKALHAVASRKDVGSDAFVVDMLISVYGKCGSNAQAQFAFECLSQPNGCATGPRRKRLCSCAGRCRRVSV